MRIDNFLKFTLLVFFMLLASKSFAALDEQQKALLEQLPPDQRAAFEKKMEQQAKLTEEIEAKFENKETLLERPELEEDFEEKLCEECIYGYDFFQFAPSTFAPTDNTSVPSDYALGPGDKVEIVLYGNDEKTKSSYVSREGILNVPLIGPVNVLGLNFNQASKKIKEKINKGLMGTDVYISLVELRSISVYLLGEAYAPGRFTMSGLSSITNALFVGGGVNKAGSLRNIQVRRNNKTLTTFDFYDFLLKGSLDTDIRLIDGDIIFIPFIENKIKLGGSFKRPYLYEFKQGETVKDIIDIAGGFNSDVLSSSRLELSSIVGSERSLSYYNVKDKEALSIKLNNGDSLNISGQSGLEIQTIKLTGEVRNPGEYAIKKGDKILDIILRAGGFTENSYTEGAVFLRKSVAESQKEGFIRSADELEKTLVNIISEGSIAQLNEFSLAPISSLITKLRQAEPPGRQVVDVDIVRLKSDPYTNFRVEKGDELHIPKRPNSVSITGEVLNSSTQRYVPGLSLEEYLSLAGGLTGQADQDKIFVILPSGQAKIIKKTLFSRSESQILPGSTVVVTRDSKPWDAIKLTEVITPILADLATSAAAIAAISD